MAYQIRRFLELLALSKPTSPKFLLQAIVVSLVLAAIFNRFVTTGIMSTEKYGSIGQALLFAAGAFTSIFIYLLEQSKSEKVSALSESTDQGSDYKSFINSLSSPSRKTDAINEESRSSGVILFEPHSFDEVPLIVSSIDQGKAVIVNLTMMEPDQAQRSVDFIAGGTFSLGGHQERVAESVFFFAPENMEVSTMNHEHYKSGESAKYQKVLAEPLGKQLDLSTGSPTEIPASYKDNPQVSEEELIDSSSEPNADLANDVG